jgi:hypothetical protein
MLPAWKFLGAVKPADVSVRPVGPVRVDEVQGTMVAVKDVVLLQYGDPEGPPSP